MTGAQRASRRGGLWPSRLAARWRGGEGPWWSAWLLWAVLALSGVLGCSSWTPLEVPGVVVGGVREAAHWEPFGGEARWVPERWFLYVRTARGVEKVPSTVDVVTAIPLGFPVRVAGRVNRRDRFEPQRVLPPKDTLPRPAPTPGQSS